MILFHRYYVKCVFWSCLFYLVEEIRSEIYKQEDTLPRKDVFDSPVEVASKDDFARRSSQSDHRHNFNYYSRGRLKRDYINPLINNPLAKLFRSSSFDIDNLVEKKSTFFSNYNNNNKFKSSRVENLPNSLFFNRLSDIKFKNKNNSAISIDSNSKNSNFKSRDSENNNYDKSDDGGKIYYHWESNVKGTINFDKEKDGIIAEEVASRPNSIQKRRQQHLLTRSDDELLPWRSRRRKVLPDGGTFPNRTNKASDSRGTTPIPSSTMTDGAFAEFSRHRVITPKLFHARTKRDLTDTWHSASESHVNHLTLGLNLGERDILVDLYLNRNLLSENYFEKSLNKGDETNNNNSFTIRRPKEGSAVCHYQGSIRDVPGSWAAVSTCKGIRGIVFDGEDTHYLEPIPGVTESPSDPLYHLNHSDLLPRNFSCGYVGRPNHPVRELFHDETFKRLLRYKRDTSENSIRGPFNANSLSRYVELVLVADRAEYEKHDSDENKIYERCKDIANIVNALYQPLNIFIALVGVEVWKEDDPVDISTDGDKTLTNFLNYRKVRLIPEHPNDNAQLLTGKVFDSGVVGKALKGPICTYQYSGGVNMDHSDSVGLVATTVAHEMGHNFGMEHDTEEDCKCPDKRCIMAPSSGTKSPSHWSSCSHEYLAISFERSMDYCLRNKPTSLFDSPVCGNGFVEAGEQCDCGLEEHCNNPCCNSSTCMLFTNATCATGHCCDLQTCRPRPAGMECRAALHECDLPEYCSGDSEYCPDNFYKEDGYPCLGGQAYCYEGMCRTHEHQCRLLWGPTGKNSHDKCYNLNKEGNTHGNCGYNWANNTYKKCQSSDIKCGMMHCKHFNERLEFGMESVSKVSHRFIADKQQGVIPCRVAQVDLGLDMVDPGLAPDGAKCGYNKMCVGQHCLEVASLRKQVCNCNGRGVCNNMGNCHCNLGFAWPDCKYPGLGGSSDSGPASNPNATNKFVVGMFIFFLGIVPLTVLLLCFVYYVRGNFKFWLAQKGRPVNSRLTGLEDHLGSALRVEVVTKNRANTAVDGTVSDARSPSPPSSQGSKSNSPLLNGHANGASGNFSKFFGKHEGFTLSPIKEKPKGDLTQEANPIAPHLVDISSSPAVTSPSVTNSIPKIKSNSQNSRPLVSGVKPQVDISGPSLQTSTNPAVQAPTPLASTTTPVRQAPQRPKSVPDASTLIMENMPSSNPKQKDQNKSSTVSRIASFLSKKEKTENASTSEPIQCNTLPRKAAKINRESLLLLEISHPMQLQATELPSNLVPVRPAPEIPMPSNIRPSIVKENQEKNSITKVSWTSNVDNNVENSSKDLPRIGSVREHSVTVRPPIPKFGSMRAPRPKSLPPPRPSQPPPRPPLPMIPGTPETEYFYDDCITVQINAPLAHEEDGTSPSQEGIYATIDEESSKNSSPSHDSLENKKDKKNIFSMLYARTKKKKNNEVTEPLYCNIDNVCSENDANLNRENSSHSPSPVIVDRVSCGSTDDGGLLSEIVTELVTREPQYMNTLSKKTNKSNGSPHKENKKDIPTISPEKINSRKNSVNSPVSSPKSNDDSPKSEKPKPYVPYSSLKPRGVFTFFNKSNSEEEKQEPKPNSSPVDKPITLETTPLPNKESKEEPFLIKPEYSKSSLAASLAGVKAASAEAKSSVLSENYSPSSSKNLNESMIESQDPVKSPVSSSSVKAQNTVIEPTTHNTTRSRPIFPPDKVLHPTDKSLPKQGASSSVKKPPGSVIEHKSSGVAKTKPMSNIGGQNSQGKSSVTNTGSQNSQGKSSIPSAAKSSSKSASKVSSSAKQFPPDKIISGKGVSGLKKTQNSTLLNKSDKPKPAVKDISSQKTSHSENKSVVSPASAVGKKMSSNVSNPSVKTPGLSTARSTVLAAAAKSGPQGTSHVASLQQKFEKDNQSSKANPKPALKKTSKLTSQISPPKLQEKKE